jgi:ribosomal protein L37E
MASKKKDANCAFPRAKKLQVLSWKLQAVGSWLSALGL